MHFLVNAARDAMQNELVSTLYRRGDRENSRRSSSASTTTVTAAAAPTIATAIQQQHSTALHREEQLEAMFAEPADAISRRAESAALVRALERGIDVLRELRELRLSPVMN